MEYLKTFHLEHQNAFNFVLFLLGTVLVAQLAAYFFKHILEKIVSKSKTPWDDRVVAILERPIYLALLLGGFYWAFQGLPAVSSYDSMIRAGAQVLLILILLIIAIRMARLLFQWIESTRKLKKRQVSFLLTIQKIANALVYFLALIFILQAVGISISPLVASLGIGGLAVGLALQPTLSNYFSGLYVAADGFIQPGDYIELDNGMRGYVQSVGWRNTVINMWNNNLVMIPNSKIADSMIVNYNEPQNRSSFILECGVSYASDLEKVEIVALEVAKNIQQDSRFGIPDFEPAFRFYKFGDSNIDFRIILQADKYVSHYQMKHEFIKQLKKAFDAHGITISFPMWTVDLAGKSLEVSLAKHNTP